MYLHRRRRMTDSPLRSGKATIDLYLPCRSLLYSLLIRFILLGAWIRGSRRGFNDEHAMACAAKPREKISSLYRPRLP
jgi:hypothetical protein